MEALVGRRRMSGWGYMQTQPAKYPQIEYAYHEGELEVVAFDTETAITGEARLITSSKGRTCYPKSFVDCVRFLYDETTESSHNLFWNVRFDANAVIKWLNDEQLRELYKEEKITIDEYTLGYSARFFSLTKGRYRRTYTDIATIFGRISLKTAAERYLTEEKFDYPLDELKSLSASDITPQNKQLKRYCLQDSHLTALLGLKFLKTAKSIGPIPRVIYSPGTIAEGILYKGSVARAVRAGARKSTRELGLSHFAYNSYCGGWNQGYRSGKFDGPVYDYDINSAYPSMMIDLPDVNRLTAVRSKTPPAGAITGWVRAKVTVPDNELTPLRVSIKGRSLYPVGVIHSFFLYEEIERYPHTIYDGWWLVKNSGSGSGTLSGLTGLVQFFYDQKVEHSKDKTSYEYIYHKLLLNSIYGKFIQLNPRKEGEIHHTWGRLFNPMLASIITAKTRLKVQEVARKHYPEHLIAIATDGFATTMKDPDVPISPKMGDWSEKRHDWLLQIGAGRSETEEGSKVQAIGATRKGQFSWIETINSAKKGDSKLHRKVIRPVTYGELANCNNATFQNLNVFKEKTIEIDINPASNRLWENPFQTAKELLTRTTASLPYTTELYLGMFEPKRPADPDIMLKLMYDDTITGPTYYQQIRSGGKLYIRPGMDCYTELLEGLGRGRFSQLVTKRNSNAQTLDEWASEFGLSSTDLLFHLCRQA